MRCIGLYRNRTPFPLLLGVAVTCLSCSTEEGARPASATPGDAGNRQIASPSSQVSVGQLIDSLVHVPGDFALLADQTWQFSGNQDVFSALVLREDSAVAPLVNCLDRPDSAVATVRGRRVLAGAMCAWALMRVAIAKEHEDGTGDWAGYVQPSATSADLTAAKRAWQEVVAKGAYTIP